MESQKCVSVDSPTINQMRGYVRVEVQKRIPKSSPIPGVGSSLDIDYVVSRYNANLELMRSVRTKSFSPPSKLRKLQDSFQLSKAPIIPQEDSLSSFFRGVNSPGMLSNRDFSDWNYDDESVVSGLSDSASTKILNK